MTFGKPGRPPEDRLLRQREIFEAVTPLILTYGARQFSMREAARAACLSVGGLYYYFPTKRSLVLHGLDPEGRSRICAEERERLRDLSQSQASVFVDVCVETTLRVIAFMRPSVIAALELGDERLQNTLDAGWTSDVGELVTNFETMLPSASVTELTSLARSVRRVMLGALIERDVELDVVRADLERLIGAQVGSVESSAAA